MAAFIQFHCPHCGRSIKVKPHLSGRGGKCPECMQGIRVPELTSAPPPASTAPPPPPLNPLKDQARSKAQQFLKASQEATSKLPKEASASPASFEDTTLVPPEELLKSKKQNLRIANEESTGDKTPVYTSDATPIEPPFATAIPKSASPVTRVQYKKDFESDKDFLESADFHQKAKTPPPVQERQAAQEDEELRLDLLEASKLKNKNQKLEERSETYVPGVEEERSETYVPGVEEKRSETYVPGVEEERSETYVANKENASPSGKPTFKDSEVFNLSRSSSEKKGKTGDQTEVPSNFTEERLERALEEEDLEPQKPTTRSLKIAPIEDRFSTSTTRLNPQREILLTGTDRILAFMPVLGVFYGIYLIFRQVYNKGRHILVRSLITTLICFILFLIPILWSLAAWSKTYQCQNNLRAVGCGLLQYSLMFGNYEYPSVSGSAFFTCLQKDGFIHENSHLLCPGQSLFFSSTSEEVTPTACGYLGRKNADPLFKIPRIFQKERETVIGGDKTHPSRIHARQVNVLYLDNHVEMYKAFHSLLGGPHHPFEGILQVLGP
jgi:prepilin-type processing-associated H-X9-DG protein